jgi:hypothetical protein
VFDFDGEPEEEAPAQTSGERLFLFVFFGIFAAGLLAEVLKDFAPNRLSVVFFFVSWCLLTVIHEAAHAVMARLCGWRVSEIRLGFGPLIGRYRPWGQAVELRAFPIVGLVSCVPTSLVWARTKNLLIYAAGPAVELFAAYIVGSAVGWDIMLAASEAYGVIAAQSFAVAAVFGAGLNLVPFSSQPGVITDGLGILQSPFLPKSHFADLVVRPTLVKGNRLLTEGRVAQAQVLFEEAVKVHPEAILLYVGLARTYVKQGRTEEALLGLQALLASSSADERPVVESAMRELRTFIERERAGVDL